MLTEASAVLGDVGEFALIEAMTAGLEASDDVVVGPGDDGAVMRLDGPVVASVDVLVEGVHFRRDWSAALDVGRKAVAVNVADLEAMGARATGILVGFSAPRDLPAQWALDCARGLREEADRAGVSLLGGDVTRARDVTVAVTALGQLDGRRPVLRSGARPGDVLAVCGRLGWAAAGLVVLGRGFRSPRVVVEAQRVPSVPYGAGAVAAQSGATAMIDVSDGLLADVGHIATASGVGFDLATAALPVPDPLQAVSAATGVSPHALMLTGGEDHALAATFPAGTVLPQDWVAIGAATADDARQVLVDGDVWTAATGFDHFRRARR